MFLDLLTNRLKHQALKCSKEYEINFETVIVENIQVIDTEIVERNYEGDTRQLGLFNSFFQLQEDIVQLQKRCVR